ncbi:MAG: LLM class flavin-dependent oxidoreductase, partial [Candidatus Marinimicrobia bacterium]|nr:LLM class flavin-dependent oxidoreductase [Candidatus Neomarinimicrobiota bacterium]
HPIGENPTLQIQSDLEFVEHLERLGYDEFWCGEHHSTGWEIIASPELFLAAVAERTNRIMLGTGYQAVLLRTPDKGDSHAGHYLGIVAIGPEVDDGIIRVIVDIHYRCEGDVHSHSPGFQGGDPALLIGIPLVVSGR